MSSVEASSTTTHSSDSSLSSRTEPTARSIVAAAFQHGTMTLSRGDAEVRVGGVTGASNGAPHAAACVRGYGSRRAAARPCRRLPPRDAGRDGRPRARSRRYHRRRARLSVRLLLARDRPGDDLTPRPPLDGSIEADVAILGAGLTGLWTAFYLHRRDPSLRIVIVEREIAGFGARGGTARGARRTSTSRWAGWRSSTVRTPRGGCSRRRTTPSTRSGG